MTASGKGNEKGNGLMREIVNNCVFSLRGSVYCNIKGYYFDSHCCKNKNRIYEIDYCFTHSIASKMEFIN